MRNRVLIHFCVGDQVEVSHHTSCDAGSASSRWAQSCQQNNAFNSEQLLILSIIPSMMVTKLSEEFNRRLCSILFFLGHVEVINRNNVFLSHWSSINSPSDLFELQINCILCLVS